jgi:hypothetical protein
MIQRYDRATNELADSTRITPSTLSERETYYRTKPTQNVFFTDPHDTR